MSIRILVVEDEPDIRKGIAIELLHHDWNGQRLQVLEADDTEPALIQLAAYPDIHVVVTDLMMPSSPDAGLRLIAAIREQTAHRNVPVIVLSARTAAADILQALKLGAMDYLVKPYAPEDLIERVARAVSVGQAIRQAMPPVVAATGSSLTTGSSITTSSTTASSATASSTAATEIKELLTPGMQYRKQLVDAMKLTVLYWELATQRSKIQFADESGLWRTYLDSRGTCSTKTLDKYLHMESLPANPKVHLIEKSIHFVLAQCQGHEAVRKELLGLLAQWR